MKKLRDLLQQRGMTQLQLAVEAKISPYRLSRLFHQRARLRRGDCRRIAKALGVPIGDVFVSRGRRTHQRKEEHGK